MLAYFIHNPETAEDTILIPEIGCSSTVTPAKVREFISARPDFARWVTNSCNELDPQNFGSVVASRHSDADVCIVDESVWRQRLLHYLD